MDKLESRLEEGESSGNKIPTKESSSKIGGDKLAKVQGDEKQNSSPEKPNEQQTKTKARKSKKQRDKEKKKNLQVENFEEKSGGNIELDEISDNKVEGVEGESNTEEISSHLVNEINLETTNETKPPPNENTITEEVKSNEININIVPKEVIDEQKTHKKENKRTKFPRARGKQSSKKGSQPNHGKLDKEEVHQIIINEDEVKQNRELTLFEENNELVDLLNEKGYWNKNRKNKINLEEAINDIKKMVEIWNKNAFTLISGSYLLNINSVESDVDFIVVLPFNYNDNNGKFVTKIMLDDEFMGIRSECNFEKREECSEKGSLYCNKATSWLRKITTGVSEINAKIHDYSFDLAFVAYPWERNSEQILNFIKSEESLKNLNEIDNFILNFTKQFGTNLQYDRFGMINSLSGYRANIRINEITAENKTKFRLLLLSLKLWAK
uniref:Polynucleotide adenylyltransferase n=1 Tax=Meloidogyne floridensis TaxID=298350 RepID=A0A915ND18_9BILA